MNFQSDLIDIIEGYFSLEGISYEGSGNAANLAARYCEIRMRRIGPAPRNVHFSDEIHDSVNGGGMLGHWGGVKLYHLVCKASEKVRANWPA